MSVQLYELITNIYKFQMSSFARLTKRKKKFNKNISVLNTTPNRTKYSAVRGWNVDCGVWWKARGDVFSKHKVIYTSSVTNVMRLNIQHFVCYMLHLSSSLFSNEKCFSWSYSSRGISPFRWHRLSR